MNLMLNKNLFLSVAILFVCFGQALAQAPEINAPITNRDRVYVADQASNTVSVISPADNSLLGLIRLGDSRENVLSALYKGALNVHGLGFAPDHRTLAVISTGSNSVTLIDTATNKVKGTIYIGRAPHEGFFTPDGKELWVTVRGEDYISVIDPIARRETRRVKTANGPGMVVFSPDGKYAYVCHSFTAELYVIDTKTSLTIKRISVASPFSPNLAITADGSQIGLTHKDVGQITIINASSLEVEHIIKTGLVTNHVQFARTKQGRLIYVTVGGENAVKVYNQEKPTELIAVIPVGALPHGLWVSDDGSRIYVGLENEDAVAVIDASQQKVVATIKTGQMPQAVVFVSNAAPDERADNLVPLERAFENIELNFAAPKNSTKISRKIADNKNGIPQGYGVIRPLGLQESLEATFFGLPPEQEFQLALINSTPGSSKKVITPLALVKSNKQGRATAQALGPLRQIAFGETINDTQYKSNGRLVLRQITEGQPREVVLEESKNQVKRKN